MLAPRSSKVAFLRAADFLFFVDAHMAERAREIAKFRMELRPTPQVRPVTSISFFISAFASELTVKLIQPRRRRPATQKRRFTRVRWIAQPMAAFLQSLQRLRENLKLQHRLRGTTSKSSRPDYRRTLGL